MSDPQTEYNPSHDYHVYNMPPIPSFELNTPSSDEGAFQVPRPPSNFSIRNNASPMYIRVTSKGVLVKGVYGDGKKQVDLREDFKQQIEVGDVTDKLLMYGSPLCAEQLDKIREWEYEWEKEASVHLKSTTVNKRGSKLTYSPMVRDDDSFKINVPYNVLELCQKEADVDSVFDLGHGVYDIVFKVSGMWRNNSNYGLSLSALRVRRVKSLTAGIKRKAPEDFEFGESKWDLPEEETQE